MATWPPYVDDDGTGTTGTPTDKALFDKIKLYIDESVAAGPVNLWTNVPYAASDFTAAGSMVWTVSAGNIAFNRYTVLNGKTMVWLVYIEAASLSGTAGNQLYIKMPAGRVGVFKRGVVATTQLFDGANHRGWARVNTNGTSVILEKDPSANFSLNSGTTYVQFEIIIEIN